ncbi:hypothetical protein [Methylobacterium sp. Gmos1]
MTNILLLETAASNANGGSQRRDFLTRDNSAWLDGWPFVVTGSAVSTPDSANVGNGTVTQIAPGASLTPGIYRIVITSVAGPVTVFEMADVYANVVGRGIVGAPFAVPGISCLVMQGSVPYAPGDAHTISALPVSLDITGIAFSVSLRPSLYGAARYTARTPLTLSADVSPATLVNGGVLGVVSARVPAATMSMLPTGAPDLPTYDYDLLAEADGVRVAAYSGTVEHRPGVTKP